MKLKQFSQGNFYIIISFISAVLGIFGFINSLINSNDISKINNTIGNINVGNSNKSFSGSNINNFEKEVNNSNIYQSQNTIIPKTEREQKIEEITGKAKSYVSDFYVFMNNKNFDNFYSRFDNAIKQNGNIMSSFSKERLEKFYKKLSGTIKFDGEVIELSNFSKNEYYSTRRKFTYRIKYDYKGITYKEKWNMTLVSYNQGSTFFINELWCETKNCTNLPFYSFKN